MLFLDEVEAPVDRVKEDKGEWEDHPRVLVYNVDVLDGGDGTLDGRGALLQRRHDSLPAGAPCGVDAGTRVEGVVATDAEGGRKL